MLMERRNYSARADVVRRVVEHLREQHAINPAEWLGETVAGRAVERVVKRLALKGLVRFVGGKWVPEPVLLRPPELRT